MRVLALLSLTALGLVDFAVGTQWPECSPVPASCREQFDSAASRSCSSLISKSRIPYSTCQKSRVKETTTTTFLLPDVTQTRTITATTTTKTVRTTTTTRSTVTLAPTTVVSTATSTATETTIETSVSTSRETSTTIFTTETKTDTSISTSYTTTSVSAQTCPTQAQPARLRFRRDDTGLPAECSCILTKTALDSGSNRVTTTVTPKASTTTTTTIKGGTAPTITVTTTLTSTSKLVPLTLPRKTSTAYTTKVTTTTTTSRTATVTTITETTTGSTTTTSTKTTSTTAIVSKYPCAPDQLKVVEPPGGDKLPFAVNMNEVSVGTFSQATCCETCFETTSCGGFRWSAQTNNCYLYNINSDTGTCVSDSCPHGLGEFALFAGFAYTEGYGVWGGLCFNRAYDFDG